MTLALPPNETNETRLDVALRTALVAAPPADLVARLLALTAPAPAPQHMDTALRNALIVEPPAELVARLHRLVPTHTVAAPLPGWLQPVNSAVEPVAEAAPRRRWVQSVYALTALALGVFLVLAANMMGDALTSMGAAETVRQLTALPNEWLGRLYAVAPPMEQVAEIYQALQRPLQWLLVGLVMWAVLDMRKPREMVMASR